MPNEIVNTGKIWTDEEKNKAASMWRAGKTATAIATALNRTRKGVEHLAETNRKLFPRRRAERTDFGRGPGNTAELKLCIPDDVHEKLKAIATKRNVSMNEVVRDAVRTFTNQGAST